MINSIETQIKLNSFTPRDYQIPIYDAIENKGYKKVLFISPRRSGKDVMAFNIAIRYALEHICVIYYCFPTFALARKALWDNVTIEGKRILSYIPDEVIESKNEQQMRIRLRNGSVIQLIGSDNYNETLIGTNPKMIVFSEYALQDPMAYQFARPILAANGGVALFISTPRGKNHMWELYEMARRSPEWFTYKLTIDDTQHLSAEAWEEEKRSYSEDLLQQEYYTSFDLGVEGTIYGKYVDKMRLEGRISCVPWESSARVHTAWDIGNDMTCVIFFQQIGQVTRVIDYYEQTNKNLEYFIGHLETKPYLYGKHFFPHDIQVKEWAGPRVTRLDKAKAMGLKDCCVVPRVPNLDDGIEHVRASFSSIWIDDQHCEKLINALENYRREFHAKTRIYGTKPIHDWSSHGSSAFMYMCLSIPKTRSGTTAAELDARFMEAKYGTKGNLPPIFQDGYGKRW
jgi:phage terminase large subunit